jgi:hypothetical protein
MNRNIYVNYSIIYFAHMCLNSFVFEALILRQYSKVIFTIFSFL